MTNKTLKTKALKKSKKVVSAIKVENTKGSLSYSLSKVEKAKYKKYFAVNQTTGKITVRKGLKKGTYKVSVIIRAEGDNYYEPAEKTVTVRIKVK